MPAPKSYYRHGPSGHTGSVPNAPDVWFEPTIVWEVKAADLSISPIYPAGIGLVDSNRGISLRFPRYIRRREDKNAEDATTAQQIAEMYKQQSSIASASAKSKDQGNADDDFDY